MRKIGIYGGTFDPIHFGHINLAIEVFEKSDLDEILFCPAFISPHKTDAPPVSSADHRLKMTHLAVEDIDFFSTCDYEIKRKNVSYTIDTLKAVEKKYDAQICLIIAQDSLPEFTNWKSYNLCG